MEVAEQVGPSGLTAWVARAEVNRSTAAGVHMLVNGRPVRDALLIRAVADAFRHLVPPGRYPVAVIDLTLPPDEVDVNVHPAKTEVRFARPREVRALVVGALRRAVTGSGAVPTISPPVAGGEAGEWGASEPGPQAAVAFDRVPESYRLGDAAGSGAPDDAKVSEAGSGFFSRGVRSLAQYANCFIVAEDADGMLIVDQHVAHERLLFEQLVRQTESAPLPRQALVFPGTLELEPAEIERFEQHEEAFAMLGFRAERFGPGALRVTEVPAIYGRSARAESLAEILEEVESERGIEPEELFRRLLATVACHSAVRKGMMLSPEKMDYILQGLASCEIPTHCPHGRVVSLRVDLGPLEREFGR
jgi:DNA mismatch repair protein MutL